MPAELVALGEASAAIGTTLDEDTTRVELTRAAVGLVGGTAAVLEVGREGDAGYEDVTVIPRCCPTPGGPGLRLGKPWTPKAAVASLPHTGAPGRHCAYRSPPTGTATAF